MSVAWPKVPFETIYAEPSKNGVYKSKEFHGSGAKIVNMGELFGYEFIGSQEMKRIQMTEAELEKSGLTDGDLLFGRRSLVEEGAGKCSIVKSLNDNTTFESSLIRVRLDQSEALPYFYYYWFKSHIGRAGIKAIVTGTNVKGIKSSNLKKVLVAKPDLPTQKSVVELISKYDNLIENNKRRIELLEESARQLYKEWFVRFRFPGHEHVKIIDGVPEGWESQKVGELLMKVKRPGKIKKDNYLEFGDFPCVDQSQDFIGGYTDNQEVILKEPLPVVVFGDHTRVLKFVDFPFACGADGTQLLHPSDNRLSIEYFYFALVAIDLSNYFYARHFKFLKDQIVLIPSEQLMQAFTDFASSNMKQISKLRDQNMQLALARDLLLPKLMNGEITI